MNDFFKILFSSEIKSLSGKSFRTIVALVAILLFTILALGLAYGTLDDLKERMDNPYTNWVDVPVTAAIQPKVENILNYFRRPENLTQYNLEDVTRYDVFYAQFLHKNLTDTFYLRGRTVSYDEPIIKSVLEDIKGNVLVRHGTFEAQPCGIIVTAEFLKSLGYNDKSSVLKILMPLHNHPIFVDIIAVVKELPSLCDFMSGPILPNMRNLPIYETAFIDEEISNNITIVVDHELTDNEKDTYLKVFSENSINNITEEGQADIFKKNDFFSYVLHFPIEQNIEESAFLNKLKEAAGDRLAFIFKEVNCNSKFSNVPFPDHFAFQFNGLDKIRQFRDGMQSSFEVNVSMQQIESAENFSMVSTLTFTTSLVLFGFALLSIGFYISSLVQSHLLKISANLGTMKAFGLRNDVLTRIYVGIIGIFCLVSVFIALAIAIFLQQIFLSETSRFNIDVLNSKVLIALTIIVLLCLYLAYKSTRSILAHTPGDLVYRRNNV